MTTRLSLVSSTRVELMAVPLPIFGFGPKLGDIWAGKKPANRLYLARLRHYWRFWGEIERDGPPR